MIRIWIDDDGIVRLEARGTLGADVVIAAHEAFYAEHWDAYVAADLHLADYRGADFGDIDPATVRAMAARNVEIAERRPPLRIAVLMDAGVGYGLGRMWEQHAQKTGWPLKVFTDEAQAWEWLRRDDVSGPPPPLP